MNQTEWAGGTSGLICCLNVLLSLLSLLLPLLVKTEQKMNDVLTTKCNVHLGVNQCEIRPADLWREDTWLAVASVSGELRTLFTLCQDTIVLLEVLWSSACARNA